MKMFLESISLSDKTRNILFRICKEHDIRHIKEVVDIYRHKPDLFFEANGFSKECWEELSEILSNSNNPYMPDDSVISFQKAKLIVKRNKLVDELAGLSKEIQQIR